MRCLLTFLLCCIVVGTGIAGPLSPEVRAEIDGVMSRLEASGCEFGRNGTWHTGTEAKAHLLRKLKYLEQRGSVQSAEQFITLGASGSSATGQPYLVKCGNGAPVESATWLSSQLQALRSGRQPKSAR